MANTAKRFEVEVVRDRKVTRTVYSRDPNKATTGNNFIKEEIEEVIPESYMVYFAGGHSTMFDSKEAMAAAGIVESANFEVDLDTGLPVEPPKVESLKARVEKNTRHRAQVGA